MSYLGKYEQRATNIKRFDVTSSTSATHTLTWIPANEESLFVTINGVKQQEDAYSVSGAILTLTDALVSTDKMEVIGIQDVGVGMVPADGVVKNIHINDSAAIAQSKLATLVIDTAELADDAVTVDKLANAINTSIAANTAKVTNATHTGDVTGATALTIAANAVNLAKLEDGTQGDILYYGASGAPARLGFGTTGDFLKTQGTGANPAWATVPTGGLVLISKNTLNSVVATWDITDQFSATYTNYLIVMNKLVMDTNDVNLNLRFGNSDLSSTESSTYHGYYLSAANGQVNYSGLSHANGLRLADGLYDSTGLGFSGMVWVNNANTTNITTCTGAGMYYGNANSEIMWMVNYGAYGSTAANVSMQILGDSGSVGDTGVTSTVTVYGLAES